MFIQKNFITQFFITTFFLKGCPPKLNFEVCEKNFKLRKNRKIKQKSIPQRPFLI